LDSYGKFEDGNYQLEDSRIHISRIMTYGYSMIENGEVKHNIIGDFENELVDIEGNDRERIQNYFKQIYHEMEDAHQNVEVFPYQENIH
jgi:hypothetical protein